MKCDVTWCHETERLMRRKADSPLFKKFGQATLCSTHVPPWRKDEYEPVEGTAPPVPSTREPAPVPTAEAAPAPKEKKPNGRRKKAAKEEAPF